MPNIGSDRVCALPPSLSPHRPLHSSPSTDPTEAPVGYLRRLPSGLLVTATREEHASALEALQRAIFPSLADVQRFKRDHYLKHIELFPEGQFVALDGDRVVAATSTIRRNFDFAHTAHRFDDIIAGGWLTSHEPAGEWLYGADLGVAPGYRGRGLARALYAARQQLVWALDLRGQLAAGMMSGFGARKHEMTAQAYFERLREGTVNDPTLSMQMWIGFEPRALIPDHVQDPICDNYSVLIVLDAAKDVPGAVRPGSAPDALTRG